MFFAKPNCDRCACSSVCNLKNDLSLFRNDLMGMKYYGGEKYADKFPLWTVKIECKNYININKLNNGNEEKEEE